MKIAYCIITHRNTNVLRTTVNILSLENDVYLHIDKKCKISEFREYEDKVLFIKNRIDIKWGGYSQIECYLNIFKFLQYKNYDYICFLSGDDLPVKSPQYIKHFLKTNKGKEFIGIDKNIQQELIDKRVKYKYPTYFSQKEKNFILRLIIKIQNRFNLFLINKYYFKLPKLYKGSNWFCLSKKCIQFILDFLDNNKYYEQAFKYSLFGDEVFFHTIIMNSDYKYCIYNFDSQLNDNLMALRYIDWQSGPQYPKILCEKDFNLIKQQNVIFARKFTDSLDFENYKQFFEI